MIVLITIALILVLLPVLKPAEYRPSLRSTDRDEFRVATDLESLRS